MKKNITVIFTIIIFAFVSCKTGDINMPKNGTKTTSSQKQEHSENIKESEDFKKSEELTAKTEIVSQPGTNEELHTIEEDMDLVGGVKDIIPETDTKNVYETVSINEPEISPKQLHVPDVEKNKTKSAEAVATNKETETIPVSDKKIETTDTITKKKETVQAEQKSAVKQEQPKKTTETTKKTENTVAKTADNILKKTEEKPTVTEKQPLQETDNSSSTDDFIVPLEERSKISEIKNAVPSRSVEIALNQYLDVFYPGAGWVYLGEQDESVSLLSFFDRNLADNDTQFILKAKKPGKAILHFYKQDLLTNTYIDDYLEVVVTNEKFKGRDHSVAPAYAEIVPPNQQKYIEMAEAIQSDRNFTPPADNDIVQTPPSSTQTEITVIQNGWM